MLPPELSEKLKRIQAGVQKVRDEKVPDTKYIEEIASLTVVKREIELENEWILLGLRKK